MLEWFFVIRCVVLLCVVLLYVVTLCAVQRCALALSEGLQVLVRLRRDRISR